MNYKGIILAGGAGTRLYPASLPISKILLPVYDKPMIYYPLSVLISAGIKDILIVTNKDDAKNFQRVLKDGSHLGINIEYKIQFEPKGIAESFILAEDFLKDSNCVLILGDNIFYGKDFINTFKIALIENLYATIFGCYTNTPQKFGVIEFDNENNVISLEEKPSSPKSNYAAVGLYIYNKDVVKLAKQLTPSARGELEITDLNKLYLKNYKLKAIPLDESVFWQDTGSFDSLLETSLFIKNEELKTGQKIGCIEEAAVKSKFITGECCLNSVISKSKNEYYDYIFRLKELKHA